MIPRWQANGLMFVVLCLLTLQRVAAQPTLPDITAAGNADGVMISWICQYEGIKAISVLRSRDSISNYEVIGYVKKIQKGTQQFTDEHPLIGRNFYKLAIVFNSGLTWRSNHAGITVVKEKPEPAKQVPPFDTVRKPEPGQPAPGARESDKKYPMTSPASKDTTGKCKVSITYAPDTTPTTPRQKFTIRYSDTATNLPIFIQSRYIHTDTATGYVDISLPEDVSTHHYSIKFYDLQNHVIIEIPRINTARAILDSRNFQHRGVYKFVIRKDYLELESGYLVIEP